MSYPREMNLYNRYIKKFPNLDPRYIFTNSGFNLRPMDINASIGLSQFKRLNKFIKARKKKMPGKKGKVKMYKMNLTRKNKWIKSK